MQTDTEFDAIVVGAGFAGMYMLHRLRGQGLRVCVLEAAGDVGGTWYWNRYPGARCDIQSMEYSYQFDDDLQQSWNWSERYATQAEILRYAEHVAERFDLRRDMCFDSRVTRAAFDDQAGLWRVGVESAGGAGRELAARFFIMATGCLSAASVPAFPGRDRFAGVSYHTGRWPHEAVDFSGLDVAVIGTGSSAIQAIPVIADQAATLTVFQRTPNYTVPARNAALDPVWRDEFKAHYREWRARAWQARTGNLYPINERAAFEMSEAERQQALEDCWQRGGVSMLGCFKDLLVNPESNAIAAEFVRNKIRAIVDDPATAELLCPDSVLGCKRLCVDSGYYAAFNRPGVKLVDVSRTPIERIGERGPVVDGQEYPVDVLVYATGFDAMTGALLGVDIHGRGGVSLRDHWAAGPRTYLGLSSAGFPNFFHLTGPGSPSVLSNMLPSIEQHVEWVSACIQHMRGRGLSRIEVQAEAEDAWVAHVNEVAASTLMPTCNSWYLGANVPGKPRVFMPYLGVPAYVRRCREVVESGYAGFQFH